MTVEISVWAGALLELLLCSWQKIPRVVAGPSEPLLGCSCQVPDVVPVYYVRAHGFICLFDLWMRNGRAGDFPARAVPSAPATEADVKVESLAGWVAEASPPGVELWAEALPPSGAPAPFVRVDDVDFSFHAIQSRAAYLPHAPSTRCGKAYG